MQSFEQFDRQFPTDDACKEYIVRHRWPDGVRCPRCQRTEKIYAIKGKDGGPSYRWTCCNADCGKRAGYRFSVTTRTIFMDTKVSLRIWFKIGYLMLTAKKGMSSLQIRRIVFGEDSGTDWRTCWYICHRWRAAMAGDMHPMSGIIEVDEAYIGGKDRNRHWGKKSAQQRKAKGPRTGLEKPNESIGFGKVGVIGAIERKGNVVARVIGDMEARTKTGFVTTLAKDRVSLVVTDESPAYEHLGLPHDSVHHGQNEYVRGNVHTNNIESFWSLLKRGVVGTYHKVSKDYLPLYLNEFSYRHNNRYNPDAFADLITTCGN